MTKREGAVLSAFTGKLLCDFNEMHKYIEELLGREVFTHELGDNDLAKEISDKAKPEAIEIIQNQA